MANFAATTSRKNMRSRLLHCTSCRTDDRLRRPCSPAGRFEPDDRERWHSREFEFPLLPTTGRMRSKANRSTQVWARKYTLGN